MSWLKSGEEAMRKANEEQKAAYKDKDGPRELFMGGKETRRLLFLDDEPACLWRINYKVKGKFGYSYVPLDRNGIPDPATGKPVEVDPFAQALRDNEFYDAYTGFVTAVDLTGFTYQKGEKKGQKGGRGQLLLIPMKKGSDSKPGVLPMFYRKKKSWGGIKGRVVEVTRTGDKANQPFDDMEIYRKDGKEFIIEPGEVVTFLKQALKLEISDEDAAKYHPYDYLKIFQPCSLEQAEKMAKAFSGGGTVGTVKGATGSDDFDADVGYTKTEGGSAGKGGFADDDDDIPF